MKVLKKKILLEENLLDHMINEREIMINIGSKYAFSLCFLFFPLHSAQLFLLSELNISYTILFVLQASFRDRACFRILDSRLL